MPDPGEAPAQRYLVSARKYRPQTFADVVAQEHVTETLRNALTYDRLAHAYLFAGPRGVGKTTAARLLAKGINCQTPLSERERAEPCRTCAACRSFEEGRDLNVIEIDAASNRKIEDVRELRESVRIPPQGAPKKVYILDEIHMLTKEAFNALLKTLEEPPDYALFIFATTEPHKVLPTILSRCQRFDFRRIRVDEMVAHLRAICDQEDIEADDASLHLIARKGDGALRDALSLFDQSVALLGTELTHEALTDALGVVDIDLYFAIAEAVEARDTARLLQLVDQLVGRGYDLAEFLAGLTEHLRNLYVIAATGSTDLLETDAGTSERYAQSGRHLREADVLRAMLVVDEAERNLRASPHPRLTVELALLRLAHLEPVRDLKQLVDELKAIGSQRLEGMSTSAPATPGGPQATAEPAPAKYRGDDEGGASTRTPRTDPPDPPGDGGGLQPSPQPSVPATEKAAANSSEARARGGELFGPPALRKRATASPEPPDDGGEPSLSLAAEEDAFSPVLGRVRDAWPRVVEAVREVSTSVATVLDQSTPSHIRAGAVAITVPDSFSREVLHRERKLFSRVLRATLGEDPPPVALEIRPADPETAADEGPFETLKRLRHEHPTLRMLFERFGAEIVWT